MSFLLSSLATAFRPSLWTTAPVRNLSKYKLKTHKGASKRWFPTGDSREFKRMKVNHAHLNQGVSTSRLQRLTQMAEPTGKAMRRTLHRLLPYASSK
ncbi:hypothetical protein BC828DRAFT_373570 [Blastocladiella britannica]|nr:hypothetical protein BC828DRAFT_373570 [Blastocladiella britannica]